MSELLNLAPQITTALVIVASAIAISREMRKLNEGTASATQISELSESVTKLAEQVAQLSDRVKATESRQEMQEMADSVLNIVSGKSTNAENH